MIVASLAVIALAVLVGSFFVGSRLAARAAQGVGTRAPARSSAAPARPPTRTSSPITSTTDSPTDSPTDGPIAAGVHPWQALLGGECLQPYGSPWQPTYTVVACSVKHAGQMTRRVALKGDDYPGASALIATLSLTCSGDDAVTLSSATRYTDLQTSFSYPTEAQWRSGDTAGYCFAARAKDASMTGSVAPR